MKFLQGIVHPVYTIKTDGIYLLTLAIEPDIKTATFNLSVTIKMRETYGYLSAVDWPFLPVRFFWNENTIVNYILCLCL